MTKDELFNVAIEWAANEGWNPGLHDLESFYATDPEGFWIGKLNGEPISCISAVKYPNNHAFVGFYIVKKEFRDKGYGLKIWQEAMKGLEGYNIGLDGVVDQQENYKKSGFKLAYRNVRYEGESKKYDNLNSSIKPITEVQFEKLLDYDTKHFQTKRMEFLINWVEQPESFSASLVENDEIKGYGLIRKCRKGYKFGPLFADNKDIAKDLFKYLSSQLPEDSVIYLDTPEVNPEAVELAKEYNMKYVFETARMYTGEFPMLPVNEIFGVTTFELG